MTPSGISRAPGFLTSLWRRSHPSSSRVDDLITPYPEIIAELERRSKDEVLKAKVEKYLGGDIPSYFKSGPVLYLARHVAARNFETLRFIHILEPLGHQVVISEDSEDIFVPHNPLKRALGKLPICLGIKYQDGRTIEEFENLTIIDFNTAAGKRFKDIRTLWGQPLTEFHAELLKECIKDHALIVDDAQWITRHHRGNLKEHYKHLLALFIAHGVLFEDYLVEDKHEGEFIRKVLRPAFQHVERTFGCRPLIARLTPTSIESDRFWLSYPRSAGAFVREKLAAVPY